MKYGWCVCLAVVIGIVSVFQTGCDEDEARDRIDEASGTVTVESVAEYAGSLAGTWQGSGLSGTFTVSISASGVVTGSYAGDDSGTIIGVVDEDGAMTATAVGSAGSAVWTGRFTSKDGEAHSGSGRWVDEDEGTSGTWTST